MLHGTYSKNFVITLALLPAMVQIVIMLVNGNLGTSVAVLGAFSLIRFRSVPGNTRDTADTETPTAALYSQDDLTLNGEGTLTLSGNYKDALTSKDNLKIMSGTLIIPTTVDDGIVGRDSLKVAGGTLKLTINGDGLDSNASIVQTGGDVRVDGPTNSGNGSLDFDGTYNLTGGSLIASGTAGIVQTPSKNPKIGMLSLNFTTNQTAGTNITLKTPDGTSIADFAPVKTFLFVPLF